MPTATYTTPSAQLKKYADDTNAYILFYPYHKAAYRSMGNGEIQISGDVGNSTAQFYAYVNDFDESFSSSWDAQQYYGKTDPIVGFKNTKRTISLSWKTPAMDLDAAKDNYKNLNKLAIQLYPSYMGVSPKHANKLSDAQALSASSQGGYLVAQVDPTKRDLAKYLLQPASLPLGKPPLIGVSWGNLVKGRDDRDHEYDSTDLPHYKAKVEALVCHVDNFAMAPSIESGFFSEGKMLYPRVWMCSVALSVQHTHELGRQAKPW